MPQEFQAFAYDRRWYTDEGYLIEDRYLGSVWIGLPLLSLVASGEHLIVQVPMIDIHVYIKYYGGIECIQFARLVFPDQPRKINESEPREEKYQRRLW
jgi:hypothetical protein